MFSNSLFTRSMSKTPAPIEAIPSATLFHSRSLGDIRRKADVKPLPIQYARGAARSTAGRSKTWSSDLRIIWSASRMRTRLSEGM